jgi:uncharacterized protein (TIGR01244 family)
MRSLAVLLLLTACASTGEEESLAGEPVQAVTVNGLPNLVSVGPRVMLAGQPTPEGFVNARNKGVTVVINMRPDSEMTFDERQLVESLGLQYVSIPFSAQTLQDAQVESFLTRIQSLQDSEGDKVLVHCSSGNRVAALWALYEIDSGKVAPEEAVARARLAGLKSPELVQYIGEWARRTGAW